MYLCSNLCPRGNHTYAIQKFDIRFPDNKNMESRNIQDPGEAEHSWDTELVGRRLEEGLLPARE